MFIADENFFNTYGIEFAEGKSFTQRTMPYRSWNNAKKVIINEKAAAQLGFTKGEQIAGKKIVWGEPYEVVGVVKDYHHLSIHQPIEPVIYLPSVSFVYFTIQTDQANMQVKISTIEKLYKSAFPGNPYEYFFAEETLRSAVQKGTGPRKYFHCCSPGRHFYRLSRVYSDWRHFPHSRE